MPQCGAPGALVWRSSVWKVPASIRCLFGGTVTTQNGRCVVRQCNALQHIPQHPATACEYQRARCSREHLQQPCHGRLERRAAARTAGAMDYIADKLGACWEMPGADHAAAAARLSTTPLLPRATTQRTRRRTCGRARSRASTSNGSTASWERRSCCRSVGLRRCCGPRQQHAVRCARTRLTRLPLLPAALLLQDRRVLRGLLGEPGRQQQHSQGHAHGQRQRSSSAAASPHATAPA